MSLDLFELLETAKKAALSSAKIITKNKDKILDKKFKDKNVSKASQIVTEVDLKSQNNIIKTLTPSIKKYNLGILAEESIDNNSRFEKEYFWCIDPLDGTLAYTLGQVGYSVSIALVSKSGEPIIGVVCDPITNDLYYAVKGHGAFKNNDFLKISNNQKILNLYFDQSYKSHPQYKNHILEIKAKLSQFHLDKLVEISCGGAVMNAINSIQNSPSLYFKLPKNKLGGGCIWDFAATSIIHKEAGGINCDYYNNPIALNSNVSVFMNKTGIIYTSSKELIKLVPSSF